MHRPVQSRDASPGCPSSYIFQLRQRRISKSTRFRVELNLLLRLHRLAVLRVSSKFTPPMSRRSGSGVPRRFDLPASLKASLQGAPNPHSSSSASGRFFGAPRISHPPVVPMMRLRGTPVPASTAGPMMIPTPTRTLHPRTSRG
jgi:hypothetical protein